MKKIHTTNIGTRVITLTLEVTVPRDTAAVLVEQAINAALDEPPCFWGEWEVGGVVVTGVGDRRYLPIGAVSFGEPSKINSARWKHTEHIGPERVALLQLVLDGKPLPEPLFLVGQAGGGSYERISPEDINWETSGLRPSATKIP